MNTEDHKRLSMQITGRVQGVGFRNHAQREARRLDVSGWVRNERDGSVRLEAEGESEELEQLRAAMQQGPSAARIEDASADWDEATGEFNGFSVRY